ncbi:hypothetical protein GCM10011324_45130 [Allosediminivita pacifica]|nr:hypothetical protein GCM10011324_45130 [Allosediminivita pacifica]
MLGWVDDAKILPAYGGKTDVFASLQGVLWGDDQPGNFDAIMTESVVAAERFEKVLKVEPTR